MFHAGFSTEKRFRRVGRAVVSAAPPPAANCTTCWLGTVPHTASRRHAHAATAFLLLHSRTYHVIIMNEQWWKIKKAIQPKPSVQVDHLITVVLAGGELRETCWLQVTVLDDANTSLSGLPGQPPPLPTTSETSTRSGLKVEQSYTNHLEPRTFFSSAPRGTD